MLGPLVARGDGGFGDFVQELRLDDDITGNKNLMYWLAQQIQVCAMVIFHTPGINLGSTITGVITIVEQ